MRGGEILSNKVSNWPNAVPPNASPEEIGELVATLDELRKLPPVSKSDPEGVRERLNYYFNYCGDYGVKPSVEGMCLTLGVSRQGIWKWENDEKSKAGEYVRRAKDLINTLLTTWGMNGKVNAVYAIWLQKNNFSYSDTKTLEIKQAEPERHSLSDLEEQLAEAGLVWDEQKREYVSVIDVLPENIKEV